MSVAMDSPSWLVYKHYFNRRSRGESPEHLFEGYREQVSSSDLGNVERSDSVINNKDDVTINTVTQKYPSVTLISPEEAGVRRVKSLLETEQSQEDINLKESSSPKHAVNIQKRNSFKQNIKPDRQDERTTVIKTVSLPKRKRLSTADIRAQLLNKPWVKRKRLN